MRADQFEKKERRLRDALEEATQRLGRHFANPAARQSAGAYLRGLLGTVERKNSWQFAEAAGFDAPYRFQHLLGRGAWDADALARRTTRRGACRFGAGGRGARHRRDRLYQARQEECGGQAPVHRHLRQDRPLPGRGVLVLADGQGPRALVDRALSLPEEWTQDPERRRAAGVPEEVGFATKPALARGMAQRVPAAGARPAWVAADALHGADDKLRAALEEAGQPYVLAVTGQQSVWLGVSQRRVKAVKTQVPADAWVELSVAAGTRGPRVFGWAALRLDHPHGKEWQRFLLLRRSRSHAGESTAYLAFGPAGTPLEEMARVAGRRWASEESFAQSKGEVGLDQHEVRSWTGWHRHMTLAMAAPALLALTRARLFAKPPASGPALAAFQKSRALPAAAGA